MSGQQLRCEPDTAGWPAIDANVRADRGRCSLAAGAQDERWPSRTSDRPRHHRQALWGGSRNRPGSPVGCGRERASVTAISSTPSLPRGYACARRVRLMFAARTISARRSREGAWPLSGPGAAGPERRAVDQYPPVSGPVKVPAGVSPSGQPDRCVVSSVAGGDDDL